MDNSSSSSSYLPYNDYNILDNRITRNLQELISERDGEKKVYHGIFDKIREKFKNSKKRKQLQKRLSRKLQSCLNWHS